MRVARNITTTKQGRFRVRITRDYLRGRPSCICDTLAEAIAARDEMERRHPITSPWSRQRPEVGYTQSSENFDEEIAKIR